MRKEGNKGKKGIPCKCPKCSYRQRVKTKLIMVCCSNCGRKSPRLKWRVLRKSYPSNTSHKTSKNHGHSHTWSKRDKRTSIDSGHSHPINLRLKLAEKGKTNHTHRLLR